MRKLMTFMVMPFLLAPDDAGGGGGGAESGITDDEFKELGSSMKTIADSQKKMAEEIEKTHTDIGEMKADTEADRARISAEVKAVKASLSKTYGPSGADDFLREFDKFMHGIAGHSLKGKVPENCELSGGIKIEDLMNEQKAAVTFGTVTDATAGYLIPDLFIPGIIELRDLYGDFQPRMTSMTLAPGTTAKIPADLTRPVATWGGAEPATITHEATPMAFKQLTMLTELLGCYLTVQNELLTSPGVNFGSVATLRIIHAIVTMLEHSVLAGVASTAGPSNGIITDATDQGNIATATFANVVTFLQACIADNVFASKPSENALFMHPTDVMSLAAQAVGASELTGMLVWGNPRTGAPTTLLGYEVISHPSMTNGTNRCIALGDPRTILLGESPSYTIDINPYAGTPYLQNASYLRAFNHYDWILGQTAEWHFSTIGAT